MNKCVGLILCDWVIWELRKTVWAKLQRSPIHPLSLSLLLFPSFPSLNLSPGSLSSGIKIFYPIFIFHFILY